MLHVQLPAPSLSRLSAEDTKYCRVVLMNSPEDLCPCLAQCLAAQSAAGPAGPCCLQCNRHSGGVSQLCSALGVLQPLSWGALRWGLMAVGVVGEGVWGHKGGARSTEALAARAGSGDTAPTHPSQGALVHKEEMIHGHQAAPEQIFHCYGMFPEHECDN